MRDPLSARAARLTTLACLLAGLGLTACQRAAPPAAPDTQVLAVQAGRADGSETALPAQIQPRYSTDLSFRVGGKLIARAVHVGDHVRQGQILARLDPTDAAAQLDAARAAQQAAAHRLRFAGQQLQRDQAQMAQDLIARAQLEQTQDAYAAAQAGLREANAQLKQAQNQHDYHVLRAEHDGLITAENGETGATLAAGQPVYTLAWSSGLDVWVDVGSQERTRWPIGARAHLQATELPGTVFEAVVREAADHENSLSGSYRIKLSVQDSKGALRPGMTATVSAPGQREGGAVRIPAGALFHQGEKPAVWIIAPGSSRLQLRPVVVTAYRAGEVLIGQGVAPGEWIVAAGVHHVHEGEKVRPAVAPATIFDSGRARTQS